MLRETGSVLVHAPRGEVEALLRARLDGREGRSFVLREGPGGATRVVLAATAPRPLTLSSRPREELRAALEHELLVVRDLLAGRP